MPDDLVLEILKGIQAKVAELPAIRSDIAELKTELPAMRRDIAILVQEGRMIRSALADSCPRNFRLLGSAAIRRPRGDVA
jgi:hypothetical protein